MSPYLEPLDYAKLAYAAYGEVTDFKNYAGLPMPTWDALPEKIKEAWIAAATAVRNAYEQDRPC